ncbi:hypothetical protein OAV92_01105 [Crocinitomicaceae bacterium]|nr:hypothetical protein [Crocinitomicaceae bacterium]
MKYFLLIPCLFALTAIAQDSIPQKNKPSLTINPAFSHQMMEPVQNLRKVNCFLKGKQEKSIVSRQLIIGASLIAICDYQRSNIDSKFGYLMRHPTSSNQIGNEVTEAVVHSFQLSFSGAVNNWLGAYAEMLYNPEQSFGAGTITDLNRNQIQLRKAFVVFGNLDDFPVYGAIGKMDTPFGQTGSVNPFTNTTMWHAFGGLAYGAQIGFQKWNIDASFMAVQGGAQFRALNTPVGDTTNVPSQVNNFVADINYSLNWGDHSKFIFGGSYMHGSVYSHAFPVNHFDPAVIINPAWTTYARLELGKSWILKGGYAKTLYEWPGTHNPTPPLNIYPAAKVSSLDAGIRYLLKPDNKVAYAFSGEFSNFRAGANGSPWERQNQIILGFSAEFEKSSRLFMEVFRTDGFVPLNWLSGSEPFAPFPPGVTPSERDAFSHGIVIGALITL